MTTLVLAALAGCEADRARLSFSPLAPAQLTSVSASSSAPSLAPASQAPKVATLLGVVWGPKAGVVSNNGGSLVSNNGAGGLSVQALKLLTEGGLGLVSNNGGSIIGNNGSGIVSNNGGSIIGNNSSGLIGNNGAGFGVSKVSVALKPLAGNGSAFATTDNDGHFSLNPDGAGAGPWLAESHFQVDGLNASFAAVVGSGDTQVIMDPASSLVAKAVAGAIAANRMQPAALNVAAIASLVNQLEPLLSETGQAAALLATSDQAGAVLAALVQQAPGVGPIPAGLLPPTASPSPTPSPTPSFSCCAGGGSGGPPPVVATPTPAPPTITSFSPRTGSGGMRITVVGAGFGATPAENTVTFGGTPATVLQASPTKLVVEVPEQTGNGSITVEVRGQVTATTQSFAGVAHGTRLADIPGTTFSLAADRQGGVWIAPTTSEVKHYDADGTLLGQNPKVGAFRITVDQDDNAWFAVPNGIAKAAPDGTSLLTVNTQTFTPWGLNVDPSNNVWLASRFDNKVAIVKPDGTLTGPFTVTSGPEAVAFDATGRAWIANDGSGDVVVLDAAGNQVDRYNAGPRCDRTAFDPQGNLWVSNTTTGTVTKLAPDGTTLSTFTVGSSPTGIGFDFQGNAWVIVSGLNKTLKLSPTGQVLSSFSFGGSEVAVAKSGMIWIGDTNAVIRVAP